MKLTTLTLLTATLFAAATTQAIELEPAQPVNSQLLQQQAKLALAQSMPQLKLTLGQDAVKGNLLARQVKADKPKAKIAIPTLLAE